MASSPLELMPKWTKLGEANSTSSVNLSQSLSNFTEVLCVYKQVGATFTRNASFHAIIADLDLTKTFYGYMGGFVSTTSGFGVAFSLTNTSFNAIAIGSNGATVTISTNDRLFVYAR